MKETLISVLKKQIEIGDSLSKDLESISNSGELESFLTDYEIWNKTNCEILEKAYVHKQLFRMYSGVNYLGNVYADNTHFQTNRNKVLYCLPKQLVHLNTALAHTQDIKNTDLLPLDEQLHNLDQRLAKIVNMKKLFLSHSSKDEPIIKPLLDLIGDIGVQDYQIFYSSHPAYGVGLGENIFERLKKELGGDVFALFLLSDNFFKSPICLCEMGAVWIKSNKQIPILIPPFNFDDVQGVFPNSLGFKINDKNQLNSFKQEIETYFGLTPIHLTKWEEKREECLVKLKALLP
ncbi:MAG: TIR domain-containing protein [Alphaproteobacteria bacterium]|nr:TIR domain-containing protein [Alphaproteobacteria bacterium]